jgi:hypothetical protein
MKKIRNSFLICFLFSTTLFFVSPDLFAQAIAETVNTSLCGQTGNGTPCPGNTNVQLYDFAFNVTAGSPSFTAINGFVTAGTYVAGDITGFTLYVTNFCAFNTTTPLQTIAASGPGAHTFNFANPLVGAPSQRYFWICTSFTAGAVTGHTITINLITAGMYAVTGTLTYGTNVAGGTQTICNPAPVGLISFTGNNDTGKNVLNWTTASETNNDFFTLERTYDGNNFSIVTTVDGAGNSIEPINYSVTDEIQSVAEITYYRLKQTDYNGHFEYVGGIVALKNNHDDGIFFSLNSDNTKMKVENLLDDTPYRIYNSMGQLLAKGVLTKNENEIDISSFNNGFYFLALEDVNRTTKMFSR